MKIQWVIASFIIFFAAAGCDKPQTVPTPDGKVPAAYLDLAAQLAGKYTGTLSSEYLSVVPGVELSVPGTFELSLSGATAKLEFTRADGKGGDIVDPGCGSSIGGLASIDIKGNDSKAAFAAANFSFNPGSCAPALDGREVSIGFKQNRGTLILEPSVYIGQHGVWLYDSLMGWTTVYENVYYAGEFLRQ